MCFLIDIPVIPDLDEVQEEDLTMQVAAPPRYYTHLIPKLILITQHSHRRSLSLRPMFDS